MKMKKILLTLMCLALALAAVSASAETAREKGVFGQLVELGFDGSRLSRLETAAEPLEGCSLTTRDGISLQITQALYEGDRVFIAYRMDGLAIPAEQKCWQAPISEDKVLTKMLKKQSDGI